MFVDIVIRRKDSSFLIFGHEVDESKGSVSDLLFSSEETRRAIEVDPSVSSIQGFIHNNKQQQQYKQ